MVALIASIFAGCDKAPSGVIPESDMVHVLAEFAKAESLIEQYPANFPDDSTKLLLKQSILKKYDADLAMYDSSLVWYAHNLKLYTELHDKAIALLEKEGNIKHDENNPNNTWIENSNVSMSAMGGNMRRVFPTSGDSANIWTEPRQWILTSALLDGYITYDYRPDRESRRGDMYSLNLKAINASGNSIKVLMALDYNDGTTSYINRTININGWSNFDIQADSLRTVKRIYGFLHYNIKPKQVTFIDSIYLLRTHLNSELYSRINIQRIAGPKAALSKDTLSQPAEGNRPVINRPSTYFPGRDASPQSPASMRKGDSTFRPKPGLNKSVIPSRQRTPNPNGDHLPKPPIK